MTVRAELSRLRRHLGGIIESRPYRFSEEVLVRVVAPPSPSDLLPGSVAPGVRDLRAALQSDDRPVALRDIIAT